MHWSQSVAKILKEGTGDLKDLASIAGEDWRILYRYQSLAGCDLRGQDLTGMDLTGCEIDKALIDQRTAIDVEFDPRPNIRTGYYHVSLPRILNKAILSFASERHYVYTAWAINNKISMKDGLPYGVLVVIVSVTMAYLSLKFYDIPVRKWLSKRFIK